MKNELQIYISERVALPREIRDFLSVAAAASSRTIVCGVTSERSAATPTLQFNIILLNTFMSYTTKYTIHKYIFFQTHTGTYI